MRPMLAVLVLLSAMPDTMAAPVVKELLVDRYGATSTQAQAFNAINLLGAIAAIPLLVILKRRWTASALVVWGSIVDALLLAMMALPLGLGGTLAVRGLEGVTDVIVFAGLFDMVRTQSRGHVATGLGIASTPLLLGLGVGAVFGGWVVRTTDAAGSSSWVFGLSAALSLAVAALASRAWVGGRAMADPELRAPEDHTDGRAAVAAGPLWPSLAMAFSDRATGGLITGTLPIALAQVLGYSSLARGMLVGLPLLLMALGAGPSGWLCDRIGSLRVRVCSGVIYAVAFALMPAVSSEPWALASAMIGIGIAGSALFASSLALVVRAGESTVRLGAFRGAGDLGFLCGTGLSLLLLGALSGDSPTIVDYQLLMALFAAFHAATTIVAGGALVLAGRAARTSSGAQPVTAALDGMSARVE
ncbi:MAG: MFS transporter [Phycisphaerales bacterium]|nr:MFS transporter [Phycisphaerales bacterium]